MIRVCATTAAFLALQTAPATAAPSQSKCQQLANIAEILATARESGVTQATLAEERIKRQDVAIKQPQPEALAALRNESAIRRIEYFIYENKVSVADARLVGYKKCLAGDFND